MYIVLAFLLPRLITKKIKKMYGEPSSKEIDPDFITYVYNTPVAKLDVKSDINSRKVYNFNYLKKALKAVPQNKVRCMKVGQQNCL
jgi:hypothetical protein